MRHIVAIVALLFVFAACQREEPKPQYQFPVGGESQAQSPEEIRMLREAVAKDPRNIQAWIRIGNAMMDTQRFNEAVEAYQKALDIDPKNVDVRVDLGTCYRGIGRPDLAVKEYRKALEVNPSHLNGYKNLGVVLAYDLKDTAGAVKAFEKYIQVAPNAPDADTVRQEIQKLKAAK